MTWIEIRGHDQIVERFRRALQQGRLGNTYLLAGPSGIGKRLFAMRLAESLLCQQANEQLMPCRTCDACVQLEAGSHPDFERVVKPADRPWIPLDLLIGDREHRKREGLCHWISLRPYQSARKVAVIEDADALTVEGANSLLKTLEEPPPDSLLILISHNLHRQLPTIRSRCQIIHFSPLPDDVLGELILSEGILSDSAAAQRLARWSGGSLEVARELADPAWEAFYLPWVSLLASDKFDSVQAARELTEFVDLAGTETAAKRPRLIQVARMAADFYRHVLKSLVGPDALSGERVVQSSELSKTLNRAVWHFRTDVEGVLRRIDRCLLAAQQVESNAHPPTLISAWMDDLHTRA